MQLHMKVMEVGNDSSCSRLVAVAVPLSEHHSQVVCQHLL